MEKNIFGTPEPSLSLELRNALNQENILTSKTKQRVLNALDNHITNDQDRLNALNRKKIVEEIYSSEESYIHRLKLIIDFFKKPVEEKKLAPTTVVNTLFGNIESIYDVNKEFRRRLLENRETIVSTFLSTAPFFKVYSVFAYGYRNIISILESMSKSNPPLHEFITRQETRPEVTMKLSSLLISPIQRIPRYLLLLKELQSSTPKSSSAYSELTDAVLEIGLIVHHIERLMKEQENVSRMLELQRSLLNGKPNIIAPGRKLLKEGKLCKVFKNNIHSKYIILLNDMILYCKDWTGSSLKCLRVLPIDKCTINAIGFKRGLFSLQCQSFSVVLCSNENPDITHEWVEAIQNAVEDIKNNKKTLRRLSSRRKPLQRKEFNQLDGDNVLNRKRQFDRNYEKEACLNSSWKKIKSRNETQVDVEKLIDTKNIESERTSYVKRAKQLMLTVKNKSPANCHNVT